jgi:hypothetical protein
MCLSSSSRPVIGTSSIIASASETRTTVRAGRSPSTRLASQATASLGPNLQEKAHENEDAGQERRPRGRTRAQVVQI